MEFSSIGDSVHGNWRYGSFVIVSFFRTLFAGRYFNVEWFSLFFLGHAINGVQRSVSKSIARLRNI